MIREGQTGQHAYILATGWTCYYKTRQDTLKGQDKE